MSISSFPAAAGHPFRDFVAALRAKLARWQQERGRLIAEQQTIALLQSFDRHLLEDIGAAEYLAERSAAANEMGRTEVGPMLAIYLPLWGRSAVNDARDRPR